jgi:hypothetical protein
LWRIFVLTKFSMPPKKVNRAAHRLNASRSATVDESIASLMMEEDQYSYVPVSPGNSEYSLTSTVKKTQDRTPSVKRLPTIKLPASTPATSVVPEEEFCHYCCDLIQRPYRHACEDCGALVCEQAKPRNSGCLLHKSLRNSKVAFACPMCYYKKKEHPPYMFVGYGMRNQVKMLWPLCIIGVSLEAMKDDYIGQTVRLDLENHYNPAESRVGERRHVCG